MAFLVQNDTGSVANANAYVDVAFFDAYHLDRGNSLVGFTGDQKQQAIVKATDYLDQRFRFVGQRISFTQRTQWPRSDALDRDDNVRSGIPYEIKEACAEYGFRALSADLNPDPVRDSTGQTIQSKSESVGPISESVTYVGGGALSLPAYPAADQRLFATGLVVAGGDIGRA